MGRVWLERTKYPDRPHYGHWMTELGDDEHGLWLAGLPGEPVRRGDVTLFDIDDPGLVLVPRDGRWWQAWYPRGRAFSLYVDIATPPERHGDRITMVDLDFDVIRYRDGRVELADADEFAEHQVAYGYPPEVVAGAERSAAEVLAAVEAGEAPFDGPPPRWLAMLDALAT